VLPSLKIQNGGWPQDGGENFSFILTFQKWLFKKINCAVFLDWNYNFWVTIFFLINSKWLKNLKWLKNSKWLIFIQKIMIVGSEAADWIFLIFEYQSFHVKRCKKGLFSARTSSISLKIGIIKVFSKKQTSIFYLGQKASHKKSW
jgi:hypothetical protein